MVCKSTPEGQPVETSCWTFGIFDRMRSVWNSILLWIGPHNEVRPAFYTISPYENLMEYAKCPVLLTTIQVASKILPCGHSFDEEALRQVSRCPIDRGDIEKIERDEEVQAWLAKMARVSRDDLEAIAALQKEIEKIQTARARHMQDARAEDACALEESLKHVGNESGLYLLATCTNEACGKVQQECWSYHGKGKFDMSEMSVKAKCPSCDQSYEDVNTAAIRGASVLWHGRMATGERKEEKQKNGNAKWVFFPKLSEWRYISVKVDK